MKKTIKQLVLPALMLTGSIAFAQNEASGKTANNQAKPIAQQTVSNKQTAQHVAKPMSSVAVQHPKVVDKKTVVNSSNASKK